MGFLDTIGGITGQAYQGFQKGWKAEADRQRQESEDAYRKDVREQQRKLLPKQTQLQEARLDAGIADHSFLESQRGIRQETDAIANRGRRALADGEVDLAKIKQGAAIKQAQAAGVIEDLKAGETLADARTNIAARAGEYLVTGNLAGLAEVMRYVTADRFVFPDWPADFGDPEKIEPVRNASGQDVLRVTTKDGTVRELNPAPLLEAYRRRQEKQGIADAKILKPGERWVTPQGRTLAEGGERPFGTLVQDENGNWVNLGRSGSGASGGGTGSSAKEPPTPRSIAEKILTDAFDKQSPGKEFTISDRTRSMDYLSSLYQADPNLDPATAARIAADAVENSEQRVTTDLDSRTGTFDLVYQNPSVAGGRAFRLGRNSMTAADLEATKEGRALGKEKVTRMLDAEGKERRDLLVRGAFDDEYRRAIGESVRGKILSAYGVADEASLPQAGRALMQRELSAIENKFDLIRRFTPDLEKTIGKKDGRQTRAEPSSEPAPGTPPEVAERMRQHAERDAKNAAARRAKEAEEARKREAEDAEGARVAAWLTPAAIRALKPSEVTKYRGSAYWKYLSNEQRRLLNRRTN